MGIKKFLITIIGLALLVVTAEYLHLSIHHHSVSLAAMIAGILLIETHTRLWVKISGILMSLLSTLVSPIGLILLIGLVSSKVIIFSFYQLSYQSGEIRIWAEIIPYLVVATAWIPFFLLIMGYEVENTGNFSASPIINKNIGWIYHVAGYIGNSEEYYGYDYRKLEGIAFKAEEGYQLLGGLPLRIENFIKTYVWFVVLYMCMVIVCIWPNRGQKGLLIKENYLLAVLLLWPLLSLTGHSIVNNVMHTRHLFIYTSASVVPILLISMPNNKR